jgi:hypothetical protein
MGARLSPIHKKRRILPADLGFIDHEQLHLSQEMHQKETSAPLPESGMKSGQQNEAIDEPEYPLSA